ncbi:hypothetical protein CBOM_05179 [Ceraceosorus bombacis]|uniref:Uncharacterized protein n=1 Tax=Ceraceosorus bombacis TaxID=401625 RepID=A0A0P1BJB4_9BASI|nr:hypothetical protein CBOM_05179 [Ceraceosorus bombacis]
MGHKNKRNWDPAFAKPDSIFACQQSSVDKQASLEAMLEKQNREIQRLCKRLGLDGSGSSASVEILSKEHTESSAVCASPVVDMEVASKVQNDTSNVPTGKVSNVNRAE